MRKLAVLVLVAAFTIAAAPAKKKSSPPPPAAPAEVPHSFAMYLGTLSNAGTRQVTFRARAHGVRFFFEEPTGVTVYRFEKDKYIRETFLKNVKLDAAIKRYVKK